MFLVLLSLIRTNEQNASSSMYVPWLLLLLSSRIVYFAILSETMRRETSGDSASDFAWRKTQDRNAVGGKAADAHRKPSSETWWYPGRCRYFVYVGVFPAIWWFPRHTIFSSGTRSSSQLLLGVGWGWETLSTNELRKLQTRVQDGD
jgi:hypothetical protein